MYGLLIQGSRQNGHVTMVSGAEFVAHDEEGTGVGVCVHEEEAGGVVAAGRLAAGREDEDEEEFEEAVDVADVVGKVFHGHGS